MPPRKKQKEIVAADSINEAVNPLDDLKPVIPVKNEVVKAKRERKSKKYDVVAIITPDGIQGNLHTEQRNKPLIAHLPIHSSEILFHDQPLIYDPSIPPNPVAFDAGMTDPFSAEANYELQPGSENLPVPSFTVDETPKRKESITKEKDVVVNTPGPRKQYGPTQLLTQFANTKHSHELPESVTVGCFWCCESFEGRPCVIPSAFHEPVWHVYGNFCTPQCAMAYLLSEILDTHMRWERIAMLNRLYSGQCNGRVYPAPSRETLERFGGPMKYTDFRAMCELQRVRVDIQMPPMVSILASMDTKPIDFYETSIQTKITNVSVCQPVNKAEDGGLKLKRSKPLKDRESTLDSCLNIQIKGY